jgi:hypothetical protein
MILLIWTGISGHCKALRITINNIPRKLYDMKMKPFFIVLIFIGQLKVNPSSAQTPAGYKLPDSFQFDYTVTQTIHHAKKIPDSSVMHFFYSKSGDYAGAEIRGHDNMKGNLFVVLTREGNTVIFDERNKSITIISIRKLASDLAGLTKWIRMDSVIANMRKKTEGKNFQSVKTGNKKLLGNYTTEEYILTDRKGHKGTIWVAKVDFSTQGDYIMGAVGANMIKMMSSNMASHPLLQALTQPKTLVTGIEINDSTGTRRMEMQTQNIDQAGKSVSTAGYSVNDYSNMTLPEIFQAEMKKRNH